MDKVYEMLLYRLAGTGIGSDRIGSINHSVHSAFFELKASAIAWHALDYNHGVIAGRTSN